MEKYQVMRANEITGDPHKELLALHKVCFGQYEGVLPFDEVILRWYIQRPGLGLTHTFLALYKETIVSSLFLTLSVCLFEKKPVPIGIIDTVMTHPDHRGKGLATKLMKEAEALMRAEGCWFGYLYTVPETSQFALYQKLGYRDFQRVFHLQGKGQGGRDPQGSTGSSAEDVRHFLNETLAGYNGFIPFDETLWRWRKQERPEVIPAKVFLTRGSQGKIEGTITATWGEIVTAKGEEAIVFLSDWAGISSTAKHHILETALSSLGNVKVDILCPESNQEEWMILEEQGFLPHLPESAMLLPLHSEAEQLLQRATKRPWYPLIESVVGV